MLKVFPHTLLEPSRDALMKNRTVSTVKWTVLEKSSNMKLACAIKVVPRKASFVLNQDERSLFCAKEIYGKSNRATGDGSWLHKVLVSSCETGKKVY